MRKLAIFSFSFSAAVAAWLYTGLQAWPAIVLIIPVIAAAYLKGEYRTRIILVAAGAAVGFLWCVIFSALFYQPAVDMAGSTRDIACEITDFPQSNEYGTYYRVRIDGPRRITAILRLEANYAGLNPGDRVSVNASLSLADEIWGETTNYYTSDGVFVRAYSNGEPEIDSAESVSFRYYPVYMARAVKEKVAEIFPEDAAGFITAIVTGDRTGLQNGNYTALQRSGAAHVVAVSGMHISFLVTLFTGLMGNRRRLSYFCIPILLIFRVMVGFSPSVTRAGIMQIFLLIAPVINRENDTITSLSAALLALLAASPFAIGSVSLQLSFAAVLGLSLVSGRLSERITAGISKLKFYENKYLARLMRVIVGNFSASIGAMVFTVPIMALVFQYISVYSVLTNILVLWAASLAFMGGVFACLIGFPLPILGAAAAWLTAWPVRYLLAVCRFVSQLPGALLYTVSSYIRIWLLSCYAIAGMFVFLPGKGKRPVVPIGLCAILFCLCFLLTSASSAMADMEITALNVGQGQSVVVSLGAHTVMVDCGSETKNTSGDIGAKYLFGKNIFSLDLLILTHFDADHVNGVTELMTRLDVGTLVIPKPEDGDNIYYNEILDMAEDTNVRVCYAQEDMVFHLGSATVTVYSPVAEGSSNDSGLSVLATCGDFDLLVTGDMNAAAERRLVKLKELPDVEVIIVGHHGSKYSSSEQLLETVKAEVAIVSAGAGNNYGHPHEEILGRLEEYGSQIFRTDYAGNVTVKAR